ncbi:hypothetical protein KKB44_05545 [Candidatus Micrarchaeota archaeon]|nr:hypothetical protein [Candidatus Micrarchaeota archaeon]
MRWFWLFLFAVLLLSFGCIEEKSFTGTKSEQLISTEEQDLDGDGISDYAIYDFSPVIINEANMKVQRQITVNTKTTGTYTSINPELTDVDLLIADQSLEEFSQTRIQSDTACSNNIGLASVVCSDVTTCSKLCSSTSIKCRNIAETYEDELAGAMISYVQANNEIRSLLLDSRRMVFDLRNTTDANRDVFLGKIRTMISKVGQINANPLYANDELKLCAASDFGVSYLVDAAEKIGVYRTEVSGYHYRMMISVKPTEQKEEGEIGVEVGGIGITDTVPQTVVADSEELSSIQKLVANENGGTVKIEWNSEKLSQDGYLLIYEFDSDVPPETAMSSLKTPTLTVRTVNLSGLIPINFIFLLLDNLGGNYYIALGITIGLTLAILLFIYNIVILVFTIVSEKMAGATTTTGFRKAFGRTEVRWKSDIVFALLFLVVGLYVSVFMAVPPITSPPLLGSIDFLLENGMGATGIALIAIGTLMVYFTIENIGKIIVLEKAYGSVMKSEREAFVAKADKLKDRISELRELVKQYSEENFDVSQEYDTLTGLQAEKIDTLAKNMTPRSKALIDEYLGRAERTRSSLKEKKKLADENWLKWKEMIAKLLEEQDEVYSSSLVTIPASLRTWALGRYAKEEGILMDRDAIKKVKITPEKVVREMIKKDLIKGIIILKKEAVVLTEFSDGSNTVVNALALKLRNYLRSLAKNLGQHQPQSYVAIGEKTVIVLMKGQIMESILILEKAKFNEAIEQWKTKMKMLESS